VLKQHDNSQHTTEVDKASTPETNGSIFRCRQALLCMRPQCNTVNVIWVTSQACL